MAAVWDGDERNMWHEKGAITLQCTLKSAPMHLPECTYGLGGAHLCTAHECTDALFEAHLSTFHSR